MERDTLQRRAIRHALEQAGRPLAPQEVLQAAQGQIPGLGIATVYRTVKGLVEEGWLTTVALAGEPARYELSRKDHHHHFHCRDCGRVYDVEGCPGNLEALTPEGFETQEHVVVLYGRCQQCAGKPKQNPQPPSAVVQPAPSKTS